MKTTDLMIGDWVLNTCDNLIQVAEVLEDGINGERNCEYYDDIKPIPLTPEILNENGWWYDVEDMWLHDKVDFGIERWNGGFQCYNINQIKLDSVHELQHALRLCGLNELADNFTV